ncbi:uricase [Lucilia sericata]|uniref:Uricase n=1 Tax=Lucilia sericata TaxID=13632 RepID=A0A1S6QN26_LUCSE|nr:uricase [Lucilia sericata]AQW35192.1 urate oxidase [Lucilia sericata]
MFARPLQRPSGKGTPQQDREAPHQYTISDHGYGKDSVKVLHVKRDGPVHSIKEFEVGTHLKLYSKKDYFHGDNSDIVATDSQKNTVYLLAKKFGIENPEKFGLILASHFLNKYAHVEEVHIHVEEYPWQRICQDQVGGTTGACGDAPNFSTFNNRQKHNHAFIFTPTEVRYCDVVLRRTEPKQTVISGIRGLRVLKTTQSSFVNFVNDEFRSLPDQYDRIFSTIVDCSWEYSRTNNVKFCQDWNTVKNIIIKKFAGDPNVGTSSPSVQHTLYLTEKEVLDALPEVSVISMTMPNKHYFNFDTKPFQSVVPGENNEVFIPVDKPHGTIYAQLARKDLASHL